MLQTNLLEVRGVHVAKGFSGHPVISQDGQIVLSGQFAQQVDQLLLHARLLQYDDSSRGVQCDGQMFLCILHVLYLHAQRQGLGIQQPLVLDHPVVLLSGVGLPLHLHLEITVFNHWTSE